MIWRIAFSWKFWLGALTAAWALYVHGPIEKFLALFGERAFIAVILVFLIALFLFGLYRKIMEVKKR